MNDPAARRRITWLVVIGGCLLLAVLVISFAAPDPSPASPTLVPGDAAPAEPASSGFSLGPGALASLAWRLALVVIVIAGSIIGLRWWARRMAAPRSTTGFLRVVDTLPIANGRTIHLLALGDRVIAIGATAQQITTLNELTPEEAARVLAEAERASPAPLGEFAAQLLESLRRHQTPAATPPADPIIGAEPRR
ncbi:flagellar biosynthetic protein FliO [Tepidiforma sp.]|uniref:FliO/MopB family protein n=1 Tax=Tepidiforma sp. TaxID=2682230 RepID=UPI002ADDA752|nr:flagellar biosynthetic protein FliO [Tepidiforma sp.]